MKIKLASTMAQNGQDALGLHAGHLYSALGSRVVAIVEVASIERTEVATDEDKEPVVTLQIKNMEVAGEGQEEPLRDAMRALNLQRTAFGTLTEDNDVELAENTLARCAGDLSRIEAARLHVAIEKWAEYARSASRSGLTGEQLRKELKTIGDALTGVLYPGAFVNA
jgi:hypothetical protein